MQILTNKMANRVALNTRHIVSVELECNYGNNTARVLYNLVTGHQAATPFVTYQEAHKAYIEVVCLLEK